MIFVLLFSHCAVHGFERAAYNVIEGSTLAATFSIDVKGRTGIPGAVIGTVTSERGTARKILLEILLGMWIIAEG